MPQDAADVPLHMHQLRNVAPSLSRAQELPFIASMGIYVAKASAIKELLTKHFPSQHDFGSDIIPGAKDLGFHVQALLLQPSIQTLVTPPDLMQPRIQRLPGPQASCASDRRWVQEFGLLRSSAGLACLDEMAQTLNPAWHPCRAGVPV